MKMFYILIIVLVLKLNTFVKTHHTTLKENFIIYTY